MKSHQFIHKMAICLVILIGASCFAADWAQWRGPNRDGKLEGFTAPQTWPEQLTQHWTKNLGMGCATPALVGDKLFVLTRQAEEEVALCLNAKTGEELWKDSYAAQRPTGGPGRFPGPRCACTVADGKLITLGVAGVLSCLDTQTGKVLWRKDPFPKIVPDFFTSSSPMIINGMVIAHLGGKKNTAMIAYDLADGTEKWRWTGEAPEYGSPVLMTVNGTKQIVTPTEKNIVGVGLADGKLLWQYPFAPASRDYNSATPIINDDTVIISGVKRGIRAFTIKKQDETFSANEIWNNPDIGTQYSTPVLVDGMLFGMTNRNRLFCLDTKTGQPTWLNETANGKGGYGAIVGTDDCLFLLTDDSTLTAFKPDTKAYTEIARYTVAKASTVAHPVISGNRIFIKDKESLTMWSIENQ